MPRQEEEPNIHIPEVRNVASPRPRMALVALGIAVIALAASLQAEDGGADPVSAETDAGGGPDTPIALSLPPTRIVTADGVTIATLSPDLDAPIEYAAVAGAILDELSRIAATDGASGERAAALGLETLPTVGLEVHTSLSDPRQRQLRRAVAASAPPDSNLAVAVLDRGRIIAATTSFPDGCLSDCSVPSRAVLGLVAQEVGASNGDVTDAIDRHGVVAFIQAARGLGISFDPIPTAEDLANGRVGIDLLDVAAASLAGTDAPAFIAAVESRGQRWFTRTGTARPFVELLDISDAAAVGTRIVGPYLIAAFVVSDEPERVLRDVTVAVTGILADLG